LNRGKRRLIADFFETNNDKSYEIGAAVDKLYGSLAQRTGQLNEAQEREGIKVQIKP